ncbi:transcriptional repressor LexA [Actinobaculum suis]|nr:transcriptional repressor LexA [Actinobaculum suis]
MNGVIMSRLPELTERQASVLSCIIKAITQRHMPPTIREICKEVGLSSPSSVKHQLDSLERLGYISRDAHRPRKIELTELALERHGLISGSDSVPGEGFLSGRNATSEAAGLAPVLPLRSVTGADAETGAYASGGSPAPTGTVSPLSHATYVDESGEVEIPEAVNVPVVGRIAAGAPILADQQIEDVFPLPRQLTGSGELFTLKVSGDSMMDAAICDGDWVVVRRQPVANNGEIVAAMIDGEATVKVLDRRNGHITLLPRNENYDPIPADEAQVLGRVVMVMRRL